MVLLQSIKLNNSHNGNLHKNVRSLYIKHMHNNISNLLSARGREKSTGSREVPLVIVSLF